MYTRVIPNILVEGIPSLLAESNATVFYVCNLITQPGETDNYNVLDHVNAIIKHSMKYMIDYVIVNDEKISEELILNYKYQCAKQVLIDEKQIKELEEMNIKVICSNFVDIRKNYIRHNSDKIGQLLLNYINEKK